MDIRNLFKPKKRSSVGIILGDKIQLSGYTPLWKNPEVMAGCQKIAELIGSTTIHLMSQTKNGDERIVNELSRLIDIDPMPNMTRSTWMQSIVMNMLLYGDGNAVVIPHTKSGYLQKLEPVPAWKVTFLTKDNSSEYRIQIDGKTYEPENILHFVYNPDRDYPWKGQGITVNLRSIVENLTQASETEKVFLSSKYKPSLIVKVDGLVDEFSSPEGRAKLTKSYLESENGAPWIIPADQFQVEQVKPLTLNDLAIKDTVEIDKKTVASILGVPPFLLGVGEYKQDEWNTFINTKIMALCKSIAQELTKKLILSPKWYLKFNVWSLMDYNLKEISDIMLQGSDRGFLSGDEWRDRMNLDPAGLTEYRVLENYIPWDQAGDQKKLIQKGDNDGNESN